MKGDEMLHKLVRDREVEAMERYHAGYNNIIFVKATVGKSTQYANALIDESLAICGSPYYKLSNRKWSAEAIEHLNNFAN